jgi:Fur family ferric uptake transcriptional regulator
MTQNKKVYEDFLLKHNLKSTKQRNLIFETFLKTRKHVSAEEFCAMIKKIDPTIGQATVYRMLKLLTESGIARKLEMGTMGTMGTAGTGLTLYELDKGRNHHDHLVCERCSRCIEFHDERLENLQEELAEKDGFVLTGHTMLLYGICSACREKETD